MWLAGFGGTKKRKQVPPAQVHYQQTHPEIQTELSVEEPSLPKQTCERRLLIQMHRCQHEPRIQLPPPPKKRKTTGKYDTKGNNDILRYFI